MKDIRIQNGRAVDHNYYWTPVKDPEDPCPLNTKVQLLGAGGLPNYGYYDGRNPFWTHWAGLPKLKK